VLFGDESTAPVTGRRTINEEQRSISGGRGGLVVEQRHWWSLRLWWSSGGQCASVRVGGGARDGATAPCSASDKIGVSAG
jgi:hypothetical protein